MSRVIPVTPGGPQVGDPAPDLALPDQHGATVRLSAYAGRRTVLLMFYPYAFSGVCTGELAGVRERQAVLESATVQVLAVSCDPVFTLRAFADRDGLTFPLLSDFWPHGEATAAYGVLDPDRGCPRRSSFVVGPDGVVRWAVHRAMGEARDLDEQVAVLDRVSRGSLPQG